MNRAHERWLELDWTPTNKGNIKLTGAMGSVLVYQSGDRWKHMIYFRQPVWSYGSFATAQEAQLDAFFQIVKAKLNPSRLFPQLETIPW